MSKGRTNPPSLLACIPCRKSHVKCDGTKPLCGRCADRRNVECVWMDSKRGYRQHWKTGESKSKTSDKSSPMSGDWESESYSLDEQDQSAIDIYLAEDVFNAGPKDLIPLEMQCEVQKTVGSNRQDELKRSPTDDTNLTKPFANNGLEESLNLLSVFYKYFHPAHPFVVPLKLFKQRPSLLPEPLRAVMRFVASHYVRYGNRLSLQKAATIIFSNTIPEDGFKVQALLLYAIACFARDEQAPGAMALNKAIDLAVRMKMNYNSFALDQAPDDPVLQEFWRRTWWSLYMFDGLVTAIGGQELPFRLHSTFCDVPLPGDCETYNECRSLSESNKCLIDMRNRTFSSDIDYEWSSMAYAVEAMYIMGTVFQLGPDTFAITDPQVEAIDASISNFLLSLPPDKRDIVTSYDGTLVDECLLLAHLIIHWASINLHRPRSTLTFVRNHYRTVCTMPEPPMGLPALNYASHTSKTLRSANSIINLTTIPRSSLAHSSTPILICGITIAATVHIPAYTVSDRADQITALRERLKLSISALRAFGEVWPRADLARKQIASFAREVLMKPITTTAVEGKGPDSIPQIEPLSSDLVALMPQFGYDLVPFNDTAWMESLLQTDIDVDMDRNALVQANSLALDHSQTVTDTF